jgi:hypothetical protein
VRQPVAKLGALPKAHEVSVELQSFSRGALLLTAEVRLERRGEVVVILERCAVFRRLLP